MTNIYWEFAFIIIGILVIAKVLEKIKLTDNRSLQIIKIFCYSNYFVCVLVIEFAARGAMIFGDGYDYYQQAVSIIQDYGFNIKTMISPTVFDVRKSWHIVPSWEFTFFVGIFGSTKCIAIFHIILTNIATLTWLKFFKKIGLEKSGIRASLILICSLYIKNFTVPALKDALVYFLFAIIAYALVEFYLEHRYKSVAKMIVPIVVLVFTRMYLAAALMVVLILLMFRRIIKLYKRETPQKLLIRLLVITFILGVMVIVFMKTSLYVYVSGWITGASFGIASIINIVKRIINFIYGPFIFNILGAQSLYYPSYIEALLRLLGTPFMLLGAYRMYCFSKKNAIVIILIVPLLICMLALSVGEQESAIRQYMSFYPLLCILYGLGMTGEDLVTADEERI